jgi:membrane-associated phospholipid phosphatase
MAPVRGLEHRRALLATAGGLSVVVLAMWIAAKSGVQWPWPLDVRGDPARLGLAPVPKALLQAVAWIGSPPVAILTIIALMQLAARQGGRQLVALVPAAGAVVLVTTVAKRLGPDISLPSGHSAYAVAVLGLGAWLCDREGRRPAALVLAAVAVVMGPCRVIDGGHFVIDVIAGDMLGIAWLMAVLAIGAPRPVPAPA